MDKELYRIASEEAFVLAESFCGFVDECKIKINWTTPYKDRKETDQSPIMALLVRYLDSLVPGLKILHARFNDNKYASWIGMDDKDQISILFNRSAMTNLYQISGVPIHTQQVRAVFHEVGHIFLNHTKPPVCPYDQRKKEPIRLADRTKILQEGQAWAFAFCFSAVLMAKHAISRRSEDHDDVTIAANI